MLEIVLLQNTIMTKLYLPFQGTFIYQSCMLFNYFKELTNSNKLNTQLLYINKQKMLITHSFYLRAEPSTV